MIKFTFFIKNFLKKLHNAIINIFYVQYIFVQNPKYAFNFVKKYYLSEISWNFNSIFKIFSIKYWIFFYRLIIYLNALFGAGIIIFYVSPLEELLNSFIKYIHFYSDNIFIIKFKEFLVWFKNLLDYFSEWIGKLLNQELKTNLPLEEIPSINEEVISLQDTEYDYKTLKRSEYYQTDGINQIKDNSSLLNKCLIISGIILVIGIAYYNWDTLISYFSSNNTSSPKPNVNIERSLIDLSNDNSRVASGNTSPITQNAYDRYFNSPDSSSNSSSGTSSSSQTLRPNSPEPLMIKLNNLDKYNPSYPESDILTDVMVALDKNIPIINPHN